MNPRQTPTPVLIPALLPALALALLLPGAAAAQTVGDASILCRSNGPGDGTLRGRLVTAPGVPAPIERPRLELMRVETRGWCSVVADETGGFEFLGLGRGRYRLTGSGRGLASGTALDLAVDPGDALRVDLPIELENGVSDCLASVRCAPILTRTDVEDPTLSDERALELTGLRIALALAGEDWPEGREWVACVDAPPEIVSALARLHPAAPGEECGARDGLESPFLERPFTSPVPLWHHHPSDRPAQRLRVVAVERTSETRARIRLSYFRGARDWGGSFDCRVEIEDGRWTPIVCASL